MKEVTVFVKTQVKNSINERNGALYIGVRAAPKMGKANAAVVSMLADYFSVSEKAITLVRGRTSPKKIFTIATD